MFALASASPADIMPLCFEGLGILPAGRFKFGRNRKSETPPFHFPESPIPPFPLIFSYHITSVIPSMWLHIITVVRSMEPSSTVTRSIKGKIRHHRRAAARPQPYSITIRVHKDAQGCVWGGRRGERGRSACWQPYETPR